MTALPWQSPWCCACHTALVPWTLRALAKDALAGNPSVRRSKAVTWHQAQKCLLAWFQQTPHADIVLKEETPTRCFRGYLHHAVRKLRQGADCWHGEEPPRQGSGTGPWSLSHGLGHIQSCANLTLPPQAPGSSHGTAFCPPGLLRPSFGFVSLASCNHVGSRSECKKGL